MAQRSPVRPIPPFTVIIPARFAATRLPGKPLLDIGGRPLLQHAHDAAVASAAEEVIIATDDARIADAARRFCASVELTSPAHASGTDRIAEVVRRRRLPERAVVVNVQGDEVGLPPALVNQVASALEADPQADIATLCEPIPESADWFSPDVVKVVFGADHRALYFSRACIPWGGGGPPHGAFRHIGLYAYRAGFLARFASLEPCALERSERLEQLRALHHGCVIRVERACEAAGLGVDSAADLERARRRCEGAPTAPGK